MDTPTVAYKRKDFVSDQAVRWCPGCGDYSILKAIQSTMPHTGAKREDTVFISGIGCSSRFPYYMNTYGLHSLHGRAPAFSTGTKLSNPNLRVWTVTGDGDALAIGGNHFIHVFRRNVDLNVLLFNNEIYGLTKGQFSPTSPMGKITKSSPQGVIDAPFHVASLAVGAGCKFFARVPDKDAKYMQQIFLQAESYKGASLIEILQNCNIFNDKCHDHITTKAARPEGQLRLEHGKPMLFGENNDKGLVQDGFKLKVVQIGVDGVTLEDILIHDAHEIDPTMHMMLARMDMPDFPVAMGVIRSVNAPSYDQLLTTQIAAEKANSKYKDLDEMFRSGNTWEIT